MKTTLLSLTATFLLLGCSAEAPEPPDTLGPDAAVEEPPGPQEVTLVLDDVVGQTDYQTVVVSGRGPANGIVVYHAPARGEFTEDIGPTGDFCIDVPLLEAQDNDLSFYAIDVEGNQSKQAFLTVVQTGADPAPVPEEEAGLRKLSGLSFVVSANVDFFDGYRTETAGGQANLVDDRTSTSATIIQDWVGAAAFAIELPSTVSVNRVRIVSKSDEPITDYKLFTATAPISTEDDLWNGDYWTQIADVEDGEADQSIEPNAITEAKYLGVRLDLDSGYTFYSDEHYIHEIQIFTDDAVDDGGPPPSDGPSCAGGSI